MLVFFLLGTQCGEAVEVQPREFYCIQVDDTGYYVERLWNCTEVAWLLR